LKGKFWKIKKTRSAPAAGSPALCESKCWVRRENLAPYNPEGIYSGSPVAKALLTFTLVENFEKTLKLPNLRSNSKFFYGVIFKPTNFFLNLKIG
jgi:hypothetical protein